LEIATVFIDITNQVFKQQKVLEKEGRRKVALQEYVDNKMGLPDNKKAACGNSVVV
jgi:hypothetical protein